MDRNDPKQTRTAATAVDQPARDASRQQNKKSNPAYRLVACDIDGTLIDKTGQISAENRKAIAALQDRGIGFTLVTGRMDRMTRIYVKQLAVRLPIIACNGAVIRDCATDEILSHTPIVAQDVVTLVSNLQRRQLDYLCYTADAVYYPADSRRIEHFRAFNRMQAQSGEKPIALHQLSETLLADIAANLVKLLAVVPDEPSLIAMRQLLAEQTNCSGALSGAVAMDIMKTGVTKGSALRYLAARLNIDMHQVVALGDHDNDVTMLATAGLGVAMEGASDDAREAAQVVTDDHELSGVAKAIYRYVLS